MDQLRRQLQEIIDGRLSSPEECRRVLSEFNRQRAALSLADFDRLQADRSLLLRAIAKFALGEAWGEDDGQLML